MSAAQTYWWLAPLISFFAFAAVLWLQWGQHKIRALRMRKPFTAHLTVAPEANDSMCFEIHLPPFRDVLLQLRIFPSLHYVQHEMIFGFIGDKNDRPQVVKVVNTFVKVGRDREQSPETDDGHYIDLHDNYHIKKTVERTKPNCYALGFAIKTRKPGTYPIRLEAMTDTGESLPTHELTVIVEERSGLAAHAATQPIRS